MAEKYGDDERRPHPPTQPGECSESSSTGCYGSVIVAGTLALAFVAGQSRNLRHIASGEASEPYGHTMLERQYRATFYALDQLLPPDAVILCEAGPIGWYLGHRRTYSVPYLKTGQAFDWVLLELGVTHVVRAPGRRTESTLDPWLAANPSRAQRLAPDEMVPFPTYRITPP